ncbi:hypothetical protein M5K25_021195 [Dendrobium thyrsiflorum]|uniref:Uncharacterized protein n=1 Tax=Dendrobium thyrsiflorum TaxID=117978 RepID=A0ABD0UCK8_DENTH
MGPGERIVSIYVTSRDAVRVENEHRFEPDPPIRVVFTTVIHKQLSSADFSCKNLSSPTHSATTGLPRSQDSNRTLPQLRKPSPRTPSSARFSRWFQDSFKNCSQQLISPKKKKEKNCCSSSTSTATAATCCSSTPWVYSVHFKCNKKLLREYPNLFNYTKDIYQIPGISSTVNMEHIKKHYYGSHPSINPHGVIPIGSSTDYSASHDRDRFNN